jgi:hypothetical protein
LYEKKNSGTPFDPKLFTVVGTPKTDDSLNGVQSERPNYSLSLRSLFYKGDGKQEAERVVFQYKFIDTPKNIWEKKDLEDVLSFDDLENGFDEEFRRRLEEAAKNKFKPTQVSQDIINEYMEDCDHMQVIMSTFDILMHSIVNEPNFEDDCKKDVSTFFVNVSEGVFVTIFFKEYIEPRIHFNSPPSSPTSQDSQHHFFKETQSYYSPMVETCNLMETELMIKKRSTEKSIATIIKNKNCDFWGTYNSFFEMG